MGALGINAVPEERVAEFKSHAEFLGIGGEIVTDAEKVDLLCTELETTLTNAEKRGLLKETSRDCYVCPCGALEMPVAFVSSVKEKTFYKEGGAVRCKRCNAAAIVESVTQLNFFPEKRALNALRTAIEPTFYYTEFVNLFSQFAEHGICVSKRRGTGVTYKTWNIDIEFLWECLIRTSDTERVTLVINNHVMRQGLIAYLLGYEKDPARAIEVLVLPYIDYPGQQDKWDIQSLTNIGHDASTIRFMLASSLRWNKKNNELNTYIADVEYRRLVLLRRLTERIASNHQETLAHFMMVINFQELMNGLKNVYHPEKFDYAQLGGVLTSSQEQ